MLKRNQVLMNGWLVDVIKWIAERYDISFSEVVRVMACLKIIESVSALYPKFKTSIRNKDIMNIAKQRDQSKTWDSAVMHSFLSRVYFEARKASEYLLAQEKKHKRP